jgi:uncharacterized BrkB/YihY/UPF0761 family membrane protein
VVDYLQLEQRLSGEVAVWSASGYVGAFIRASNVAYETPEGRPA